MMNKIILIGRITKEIEIRYTTSERACANFSIAVNRPYTNQDGKREADFINIVAWDKLAENTKKYVSKGSLVAIEGRIQTQTYEASDGSKKAITEVLANSINFLDKKEEKKEPTEEKINNGLPEEESVPW